MARQPKILFWDIETSLMTVQTFALYMDVTNHKAITEDWHIICSCYKWAGQKRVHSLVKDEEGDDKELCRKMRDVLVDADIIVHHNGNKFDVKKLNARLIQHGLEPLPKLTTVDTLVHVKRIAKFTSHRLDYLGTALGLGGKVTNSPNLWPQATAGVKKAVKDMVYYCKRDVDLLEAVYFKLLPYMQGHPNMNVLNETTRNCNKCDSTDLQARGYAVTTAGKYQRFQCMSCGSWSQGKKNLLEQAVDIR